MRREAGCEGEEREQGKGLLINLKGLMFKFRALVFALEAQNNSPRAPITYKPRLWLRGAGPGGQGSTLYNINFLPRIVCPFFYLRKRSWWKGCLLGFLSEDATYNCCRTLLIIYDYRRNVCLKDKGKGR